MPLPVTIPVIDEVKLFGMTQEFLRQCKPMGEIVTDEQILYCGFMNFSKSTSKKIG